MQRKTLPFFGLAVALLVAAPAMAGPWGSELAQEHLAGDQLVINPVISYQGATLRIAGPDSYELTKRFAGGPMAVNVLADAEGALQTLPTGRYRYEVLFDTAVGQRPFTGTFWVENGVTVSRADMMSRLADVRADLNDDPAFAAAQSGAPSLGSPGNEDVATNFLLVDDAADDGTTYMEIESFSGAGAGQADWEFRATGGDVQIVQEGGTGGGVSRLTILEGGGIGMNTTAPQDIMHAVSGKSNSFVRIENTSSGETWRLGVDSNGDFDLILQATNGSGPTGTKFTIEDATGSVGIGESDPEGDFHLANVDQTGDTVFKLASPGQGSWNIGMRAANGVFTFNKVGTPQEFSVREANHAIATLDVAGHVRGTSFKSTSSRALKTGFEALNPVEVLAKVVEMPVTSWRYKTEEEGVRHFGPVAEDFERLFGLGDGKTIAGVDADGVALVAIQGLNAELQAKDAEIEALKARLVAIEEKLAALTP